MSSYAISSAMMNRLPLYVNYLQTAKNAGETRISATKIAKDMGLGEVLVRKELGVVSGNGKPRVGYSVAGLIKDFRVFVSSDKTTKAVIVGAGRLGRALLGYKVFKEFGVEIIAAFDSDVDKIDNKKIFSIKKLKSYVKENKVQIGIITVPKENAKEAYDALVASRVKGIWSFAPITFKQKSNVMLKQENLALSLSYLNIMLKEAEKKKKMKVTTDNFFENEK